MNNHDKIKALMVYFSHWGVDEARQQRRLGGFHTTMSKIRRSLIPKDEDEGQPLLDEVEQYNEYYKLAPWYWHKLTNMLLQQIGGIPDHHPRACFMASRMASRFGRDAYRIIARLNLSDEEMRSVDSIVALV